MLMTDLYDHIPNIFDVCCDCGADRGNYKFVSG